MVHAKSGMSPASRIAFWCPAMLFGAALLAWPPSVFFWMFLGSGVADGVALHTKNYVAFTAMLYPIIYAAAVVFSRNALSEGAHWAKILAIGCIPIFSGLPWILLWDIYMRVSH